jgi:hypothetical protein
MITSPIPSHHHWSPITPHHDDLLAPTHTRHAPFIRRRSHKVKLMRFINTLTQPLSPVMQSFSPSSLRAPMLGDMPAELRRSRSLTDFNDAFGAGPDDDEKDEEKSNDASEP